MSHKDLDPSKITLTPQAVAQALTMQLETPEFRGLPLRLYLAGKGCDGFEYGVAFDSALETDEIFAQGNGIAIIADPDTLGFVRGSVVEWVDDERGRGFLVDNPNHRKFRGKFYKLKSWRDRLQGAPGERPKSPQN